MKSAHRWGLVFVISISIGCAPGFERFENRHRKSAPNHIGEVGVLARGASQAEIMELLERHTNARFRILNPAHDMYEIFGLPLVTVRGELPKAQVSMNDFVQHSNFFPRSRVKSLVQQGPVSDLTRCEDGDNPPVASITAVSPLSQLDAGVVRLHTEVRLSAKTQDRSGLRMAWIVMAPDGALQAEEVRFGDTLKYKVEALGGYEIGLVVQDQRNVCSLDLLSFSVTTNQEYRGKNKANALDPLPSPNFSHLPRLRAEESWAISQGAGVMIAVIDTGVHFNHPFLRDQMALNEKEIPGNNLDDDGNGYVDDVMGWDFQHGDPSPFDDVGHGSHVAGLAAGSRFGLAQKSKILSVKALGAFGGDVGSVAAAIRYAVDRGAQIVNLSLGTHSNPKQELLAAVDYAERKGVLLVTAAGNGDPMTRIGIDTDEYPLYPAGLPNRNILNVASQGAGDGLALYSNYGKKSVDVAATGGDSSAPLYSTFLDNPAGLAFQPMWGTSMAAPVAAGIAAQVWSANSKASALQVKMHMLRSGKRHPGLSGAILSGRGLDALTALQRKFN